MRKEGDNQGRLFWRCPIRVKEEQCKFFEWDDEPPRSAETSGRGAAPGRSNHTGSTAGEGGGGSECFNVRAFGPAPIYR